MSERGRVRRARVAGRSWVPGLGSALAYVGLALVAFFLFRMFLLHTIGPLVFGLGIAALLGWLLLQFWPESTGTMLVAASVMVVAGAAGSVHTQGLLVVTAAIGVLRLTSARWLSVWVGCTASAVAAALIAMAAPSAGASVPGLLAMVGGIALGLLGGFSRRQALVAAETTRQAAETAMAMREEHAKTSALAARQAAARDIHDVLAHSLGGLVLQLDAVEALLESHRVDEAVGRVSQARALAASGLADARRAVETLREPREELWPRVGGGLSVAGVARTDAGSSSGDATSTAVAVPGSKAPSGAAAVPGSNAPSGAAAVPGAELRRSMVELIEADRALGVQVRWSEAGTPMPLAPDAATALRRALQEALSNARKHAEGMPVTVGLDWDTRAIALVVRTPLPARPAASGLASSGGGHGLRGMRERFDALPGGSARAGIEGGDFVVRVQVTIA